MLKFAADENFNNAIVRGLLRRNAELDIVRVQDVELSGADDSTILAWAAQVNRVILTHDTATFPRHAYERIDGRLPMPGLVVAEADIAIGKAIDDILLLAECSFDNEWEGRVVYLPL